MLVTFRCRSAPSITMFGEHATTLLKLMGQSGVTPGALVAADVPAAVERLRAALDGGRAAELAPAPSRGGSDRSEEQGGISLGARALPLLDFLQRAARNGDDVTWT